MGLIRRSGERVSAPSAGPPVWWDCGVWLVWLGWVALWWNRGIAPNDEGWEPTLAYLWLRGWRPYVDYVGASTNLTGIALFALLIRAFGFSPWTWRVAFVLLYGGICWLVFRFLRKLVDPGIAFASTVATVVFFANAAIAPYLWYNWTGAFFTMLALAAGVKALHADSSPVAGVWATLCGALATVVCLTKPTFGIALLLGLAATAAPCAAGRAADAARKRRDRLAVACALGGFASSFGAVLALLHAQGLLPGFVLAFRQALGYARGVREGGRSLVDTLTSVRFMLDIPRAGFLVPVAIFLVLVVAIRLNGRTGRWRRLLAVYVPASGCAGALVGLVRWPRHLLFALAEQDVLARSVPLCLLCAAPWVLAGLTPRGRATLGLSARAGVSWRLLLSTGFLLWMAESASHPRAWLTYTSSAILILPAAAAFVAQTVKRRFALRTGGTWGVALALLLALQGVATRVVAPYRELDWWYEYREFEYPALRHLRASNAAEVDRVLTLARRTAEAGGAVFVYPKFYMCYPLTGSLPPTRLINHWPRNPMAPPPSVWDEVSAQLSENPPDLVVFQYPNLRRLDEYDAVGYVRSIAYAEGQAAYMPRIVLDILEDYEADHWDGLYAPAYVGRGYALFARRADREP